ncbi:sensor domain-containing diguanylate cyclase [Evansella sp. AB-P1]|uniref:sensor domain-containing diguanylate cyclase n=1 Tax=Evansella sp. AB-P1 TaxID=3037653 RepID=UPI00241F65EA|nr:sensor domain-containing diguanylate cyclase [Evansella sp. AB-P1]MDG5786248.1 sensor domain-containing diguanylate cyclase [Evansella sp. AB-P1]
MKSILIILLIIIITFVVVYIASIYGLYLSFLSPFGILLFAFTIRYAMVGFDFLVTSDHKYKLLFNISSNGIILINNKGVILEANPSFCNMIGKEREVLLQKNIVSLLKAYDGEKYISSFTEFFHSSIPINKILFLKRENGKALILEMKSNYMELEDKQHAYLILRDITIKKQNEDKLQFLAYHDPLTELGNRRLFYDRFHEMNNKVKDEDSLLAVVLMDLDKFKSINDRFGHATGDLVLQHVANQILRCLPEHSHASRMGGDEFAILIMANDEKGIEDFVNVLHHHIHDRITINGNEHNIAGSVGISIAGRDGKDVDSLLKHADKAMYKVKEERK